MLKRTITGAFIAAITSVFLYFSHIPEVMNGVCAVLSAFSVYEICKVSGWVNNEAYLTVLLLSAVGISIWELPNYLHIVRIVYPITIIGFLVLMLRVRHSSIKNPVKNILLNLTVVFLFKTIPLLRSMQNGLFYLGCGIILCYVTDVAAYLVGKSLGKHKLAPTISPKKTVEGSIGGIVFSSAIIMMAAVVLQHYDILSVHYGMLFGYAITASAIGQFGDLAMSSVKRIAGVKDYGNLLPGHGGVLDRFDSHLFVLPYTYLFCNCFGTFLL